MSELLNKISELVANRDVEINFSIKIGQDSVKTTAEALKVMTSEVENFIEMIKSKSKSNQQTSQNAENKVNQP